jgi:hypothetical protein
MSQSVSVIVGAVITGIFSVIAAFVVRSGKGSSQEGGRHGNPVYRIITVTLYTMLMFALMIGVVGVLYENTGLRDIATAVGVCGAIGLIVIVSVTAAVTTSK